VVIDQLSISMLGSSISMSRREQVSNNVMLCLAIFFAFAGLLFLSMGDLANAQVQQQQQQQQILTENRTDNFTLKIDVLGVNSETRNSTISIAGPKGESVISNTTVDLFSRAQQDFGSESNPVAVTIPIDINSSLLHDGDELRACLTMVDTGMTDCELTVITRYNLEGFPKSVQLEAGGSIEQQIRDLLK
jgi:hypothetical protein